MDKELDEMEFKLNGLSELYRVQSQAGSPKPITLKHSWSISEVGSFPRAHT